MSTGTFIADGVPRVQRADEFRRPVSPLTEVIDTTNGTVAWRQPVDAPHHEPGGYGEGVIPPPVPPGYQLQTDPDPEGILQPPPNAAPDQIPTAPEGVASLLAATAAAGVQATPAAASATPQMAYGDDLADLNHAFDPTRAFDPATIPPLPPEIANFSGPVSKVEVNFSLEFAGEEQEFISDYMDVRIEDNDLMVFVARAGERLWLPKPSQSAEIAVQIQHGDTVYKIAVLPLRFTYGGWQFGLAMIKDSVKIPA